MEETVGGYTEDMEAEWEKLFDRILVRINGEEGVVT